MALLHLLGDEATARYRADLARVIRILREHLRKLLDELPRDDAGRLLGGAEDVELAAKLEADASRLLKLAGYDGALGRLRLDLRSVVSRAGGGTLSGLGLRDTITASHASIDESSLVAFAQGRVDALLTRFAPTVGEKMRDALLKAAQTNAPLDGAIRAVAKAAAAGLSPTVTGVLTTTMAVARESQAAGAERSGIDLYTYDGPDDHITRPFCALFVGKLVTIPDLDAQDNGQGLRPTHAYLGGYRCRHSLSPITIEAAKVMVKQQGAQAFGFRCKLARRIVTAGAVGPNEAKLTKRIATLVRG